MCGQSLPAVVAVAVATLHPGPDIPRQRPDAVSEMSTALVVTPVYWLVELPPVACWLQVLPPGV